jgi:hypothetical protein
MVPVISSSERPRHARLQGLRSRRVIAAWVTSLFALSLVIGAVSASTVVTNGYRDHTYGGGAFRPTSDKSQSKLWYTDGSWYAGMFLYRGTAPLKSEYHIWRLDRTTHSWVDTGTLIDSRDQSHGDYFWHEASQRLYVASAHDGNNGTNDSTQVFKYSYNAATNTYATEPGFPVTIPGTTGGTRSATITRELSGSQRLWTVWTAGGQVRYSVSADAGATWSAGAQLPVQAGNPIQPSGPGVAGDAASVIAFGSSIGIAWSDHDNVPTAAASGYYFATIANSADPTVAANWTVTKLPTLVPGANPTETADNHINLKATSDGRVYMVGKTGKDTAECATNKSAPLIEFFQRTAAGAWSVHLVSTVGDCSTRPQVAISEELDTAFVIFTSPNGGGSTYMKSAPLSGPQAFAFRAPADETIQRGVPIIRSTTDTAIDDPSTMKQPITGATDLVVIANNLINRAGTNLKYYLHAEVPIAAADSTAPAGTVSLDAGAPSTASSTVSVAVPATDAGTGVSQVRLSNSATTSGGLLSTGQTFAYRTPISWALAAGDGTRTVYVQWRDSVGNWSTVASDSIVVDATAPTGGSVQIQGGAAGTASRNVTLTLAATDAGTGVTQARISNTADFAAATVVPFATSVPWTLPAGDGTKTVYVRFLDALGNQSGTVTDTITLDQTAPTPGTVAINGGAATTNTTAATIAIAGSAADATQARASNRADMVGSVSVPLSGSTSWTLAAGADGVRTVYVQWRDALGNWSTAASDQIILDTVPPTGSVVINGGKAWTNSFTVTLTFPGTETDVQWVRVSGCPNFSAAYRAYTPGMSLQCTLPTGTGLKTVSAQFKDVGNRESGVVSDSISIDTAKPTAPGAPIHRLRGAATTGIPVGLTWTAGADTGGSGVSSYVIQQSVNGAPYTTVATTTIPSASFQLRYSTSYVFRVATRDAAGNLSTFRTGVRFTPVSVSDSSAAIKYGKKWYVFSSPSYMGGVAHASSVFGASATYTFTGKQIGWLSRTGPTQGTARVYVNGTLVASVNLATATEKYKQLVFSRSWSTSATRTIRIAVSGTKRVTVDQLFVIR